MATRPLTQSRSLGAALGAQALGALWSPTPFANTIPLDGIRVMPASQIATALAFSPGSGVAGGTCSLRLTADGTHAPSFTGFLEHGSSMGWLNTDGALNLVTFWHDGTAAWVAVSQSASAGAAATLVTAAVAAAQPSQIVLTFSAALAGSPPAAAFTITDSGGADTVTAVAVAGSAVTLTKSRATQSSDTLTLAYQRPAANPLTDAAGTWWRASRARPSPTAPPPATISP